MVELFLKLVEYLKELTGVRRTNKRHKQKLLILRKMREQQNHHIGWLAFSVDAISSSVGLSKDIIEELLYELENEGKIYYDHGMYSLKSNRANKDIKRDGSI